MCGLFQHCLLAQEQASHSLIILHMCSSLLFSFIHHACAGLKAPSAVKQLANCTLQMQHLIEEMGPAMHNLSHLHLTAQMPTQNDKPCLFPSEDSLFHTHTSSRTSTSSTRGVGNQHSSSKVLTIPACTAELAVLLRTVFGLLASSVPHLQQLSLSGCCRDAALDAFGSHCPQLHTLRVEAVSVPAEALQELHVHLPGLTQFRLTPFSLTKVINAALQPILEAYIAATFAALNPCTSLTTLEMDLGEDVQIQCKETAWRLLPPSIVELRCTCHLWGLSGAEATFGGLQRLELLKAPCGHLLEVLEHVPSLQTLTIHRDDVLIIEGFDWHFHNVNSALGVHRSMRERLPTMQISCPALQLCGTSHEIHQLLSILPPLLATHTVELHVSAHDGDDAFLQEVARVLPNLLKLAAACEPIPGLLFGVGCFMPLSQCRALREVNLDVPMSYSTQGLADLCSSIRSLTAMTCCACDGLDLGKLKQIQETGGARYRLIIVQEENEISQRSPLQD